MLDSMRPITESSPIGQAMNTHGDGDHWYGNQLLPDGIPIVATASAIEEMRAAPPRLLDATVNQLELGPEFEQFVSRTMRRFDFQAISERLPNESFEGTREMSIGMRRADLIELGPAHTAGDAIVHIPDAGVLFTGDLLFIEGTPIIWEGPVSNWLAACDSIIDLGAEVLVPGHGPVTDESGVADVQRYLRHVRDETTARFEAGMDEAAAADDVDVTDFLDWTAPERIAVNVAAIYRELDPSLPVLTVPELVARMARWDATH